MAQMTFEGREESTSMMPAMKKPSTSPGQRKVMNEVLWNQSWELDCTNITGTIPNFHHLSAKKYLRLGELRLGKVRFH
jgi:hypothetical protein